MIKNLIEYQKKDLIQMLWESAPEIKHLLEISNDLATARDRFFLYLNELERSYYNVFSDLPFLRLHIIERNNAKECIRALKNVIRTENEQRVYRFYPWESKIATVDDYLYTDVSIYEYLCRLHNDGEDIEDYSSIWYYF